MNGETEDPVDAVETPAKFPLRGTLAVSLSLSLLVSLVTLWAYSRIPTGTRVPMHWDISGRVNGYGPPSSLFLLPGVLFFVTTLFYIVPKAEPRQLHLARSLIAYRWVWLGLIVFLSCMQGMMLGIALGYRISFHQWLMTGLGAVFVVIGNFMGKVRSNFLFGFRTPWTLSSDLAWNRTHRLAGRLFVLCGLFLAVSSWVFSGGSKVIFLASIGVVVLVPTVYSFFIWKNDPDRRA